MDLINRYIYDVTKNFNGKQKIEIENELRSNIDEMMDCYDDSISDDEKVKLALLELGNPRIIADNYGASGKYLIGPQYYEAYKIVLRIVILSLIGGLSIATFIGSVSSTINISKLVFDYILGIFNGIIHGFAWTTLIFYIIENANAKDFEVDKADEWNLSKLPDLPHKKAVIPAGETIFSIVFCTIFYSIVLGILFISTTDKVIGLPFFHIDVLRSYKIIMVVAFVISVVRELLKLVYRRWTVKLAIYTSTISIINMILGVFIISDNRLWDEKFPLQVMEHINGQFDFITFWANMRSWIVIIIILTTLLEVVVTSYKSFKYGIK